MHLSENNRHTLLLAIHQSIEEQAAGSANDLFQGYTNGLDYPSNGGFTAEEQEALKLLQGKTASFKRLCARRWRVVPAELFLIC